MSNAIDTGSGRKFSYTDIDAVGEVCIEDIAQALSRVPRFGGHTLEFFSVAQHSVMVSLLVRNRGGSFFDQMLGLLHDATEAYMSDLPRPLKNLVPEYKKIEDRVWWKISHALLGQCYDLPPIIKECDQSMLRLERKVLFSHPPDAEWDELWPDDHPVPANWGISTKMPDLAKYEFLNRYEHLQECLAAGAVA